MGKYISVIGKKAFIIGGNTALEKTQERIEKTLAENGVNIATTGGGHPVSIDHVNCGNPYNPPLGGDHCDLYNNNDLSDGGPFFNIEYDGFTDVLVASGFGLGAGQHNLKLMIADAGDHILDSAVFVQAGSLSDVNPIPEPGSIALMALGLAGLGAAQKKRAHK